VFLSLRHAKALLRIDDTYSRVRSEDVSMWRGRLLTTRQTAKIVEKFRANQERPDHRLRAVRIGPLSYS
jgi:hypothetical protein